MNNEIFARLCTLMEKAGLTAEQGEITRAEMAGYAEGISLADGLLSQTLNEIFISTMNGLGIERWCGLLHIKKQETPEEAKRLILEKLTQGAAQITAEEYDNAVSLLPFYEEEPAEDGGIKFKITPVSKENLAALSNLMKNYFPVFRKTVYDGSGSSWEFLESIGLYWFEIDSLELPIYVYESLGEA